MTFFLDCFVNKERPFIQDELVQNIPYNTLTREDAEQLQRSFQEATSNTKRAAAARLWETMLEKYRIPFLLLRVADMRYVTRGPGSQATALSLYAELGKTISDSNYTKWLSQLAHIVTEQTEDMLVKYKSAQHFTPAQLWIPGTSHDSLPQCCIQELIDDLKTRWKAIERGDSAAMSKFVTFHCLNTNAIEGVFDFDFSVTTVLIQKGPFDEVILREICDSDVQPGGTVVDVWDALSVLQCTVKAFDCLLELVNMRHIVLTPAFICHLHKTMMSSSSVMSHTVNGNASVVHLTVGHTRQASCVNVSVETHSSGRPVRIQFCPYDSVDAELESFCEQFNALIEMDNLDPFAAAAWISHVFLSIHPFEDGNGRISRMLASIPLLLKQLPPLCIALDLRTSYHIQLNKTRANRGGGYEALMRLLYTGTYVSLINFRIHLDCPI